MMTAIILADDDVEALGATLAALVPAVANGTLRDAVVVDRSSRGEVHIVADAAGTAYVPARDANEPWRRGAGAARSAWLFLLAAGDVPEASWTAEADRFLFVAGPSASRAPRGAQFRREALVLKDRLGRFARLWPRRLVLGPGLIVPRAIVLRTGSPGRLPVDTLKGTIRQVVPRA